MSNWGQYEIPGTYSYIAALIKGVFGLILEQLNVVLKNLKLLHNFSWFINANA